MALEVFGQIQAAEAKADEIRLAAQREARDMIKSVETACLTAERAAALEHRALAQRLLESAAEQVQVRIADADRKGQAAREAARKEASTRLDTAAKLIFERVVNHGDR